MTSSPEKGFAGIDSLISELDPNILPASSNQSPSLDAVASPKTEEKPSRPAINHSLSNPATGNKRWLWWVGSILLLVWLASQEDNQSHRSSSYQNSYSSGSAHDAYTEEKPAVGTNLVHRRAEIRYCLAEEIRLNAIEKNINKYSDAEVSTYNAAISDYNSRCSSFRYRSGDLESARSQVEANRSTLVTQGLNKLRSWHPDAPAVDTSTTVPAFPSFNPSPAYQESALADDRNTPPPAPIVNPKNKLEDEIAKTSGVTLTRVSKLGDQIPTNGGYVADSKFKILLNGSELLTDDTSAYMNFKYHANIVGDDVILVESNNGGNACPSEQMLVVVSKGMSILTKGFGNCAVPEISQPSPNQLTFTFWKGYGQRLVVDYKNRQLIERTVNLPLHVDRESSAGNFGYLKRYVNDANVERLVLDSKLNPILVEMMGADYQKLLDRLDLSGPVVSSGYLVLSGQMAHSGGSDEGIIVVALNSSGVWSAVLETKYSADYKVSMPKVRAYSNGSASDRIPDPMRDWIRIKGLNAQVTWKYAQ